MRRSAPTEVALQPHLSQAEFWSGMLRANVSSRKSNRPLGYVIFSSARREAFWRPVRAAVLPSCGTRRAGAEVATIPTSQTLPQVVFNREGDLVFAATGSAGRLVKPDGTELKKLVGHERRITGAAFSPDGQLVATASLDHTARIWSVKDGSTVATLKGHSDELTTVMFSQDGRSVLTASRDGTARIWSVRDGTETTVLRGHSGGVNSAQFSANGLYVVTASFQDRTVRLWAVQSGRQMAVLVSPDEENKRPALTRAAFNSDGTRIVIVSHKEGVRVIRVFPTPEHLIDFAKQTVPRELTACERRRFFLPVEGDVSDCPS